MNTMQWLESYGQAGAALSFIIEGYTQPYATENIGSAYSDSGFPYSGYNDALTGMYCRGTLSQSIKLWAPEIESNVFTISIVDADGTLGAALAKNNASTGHLCYLTANLLAGQDHTVGSAAGVIAVNSTTGFSASGSLYIGGEQLTYTGKTATTFTGCVRQVCPGNLTDAGTAFSPSYLIGNNVVASARTAPNVTDYPRTWYGRFVHIFLHVKDPLTGSFNTTSEATKILTGRISNHYDEDGIVNIEVKDAKDLLNKLIGPDQWHSTLNEGTYLTNYQDTLSVTRISATTPYVCSSSLGAANYTHDDLATAINRTFNANVWDSATTIDANDKWRLELMDPGDGGPQRYRIQATKSSAIANADLFYLNMHPLALALLGFADYPGNTTGTNPTTNDSVGSVALVRKSSTVFEAIAPNPPIIYWNETPSTQPPATILLTDEVNTFITQTSTEFTSWPGANGCVQIKGGQYDGGVYAVVYTSGSPSSMVTHAVLNTKTGYFWNVPTQNTFSPIRLGDDGATPPEARQVIYYRGPAGQLLLKLLLSTGGTSGFNHSTYDSITSAGFACGVPASLIDIPSWEALDEVQVAIVISEPKPFYQYLEPILAVTGKYVVWKAKDNASQPKLTIVKPSIEAVYQNTWQLTESNKCDNNRTKSTQGFETIVNSVIVEYGNSIATQTNGAVNLTVNNLASQSDFGKRNAVTIKAGPVLNVPEIVSQAIEPILAYFARPTSQESRTYNASLFRMAPGDACSITDSYVRDAGTGLRGTTMYCWCIGTNFDLETGKGEGKFVWLREKNVSYTGTWAPSARVDETAAGGGYSGDVTKILTFRPHEYTESSSTSVDVDSFNVGDKVRIVQFDSAAPITITDTIAAKPGTNQVTLTTGFGGLFDSTKRYVMEYDDYTTVGATSQRQSAFFDATTSYEWGHRPGVILVRGRDYSQGMERPNSFYYSALEPVSVHKITNVQKGLNNHLGYRSRSVHTNDYLGDLSVTGTTDTLKYMAWIPIYGHVGSNGNRGLKLRLRGRTSSGTATFTVASSPLPPSGSSYTGFNYLSGKNTATITTTSTSNGWSAETSLACAPSASGPGGMFGTFITVYAHASAGGVTATFNQLFICEEGL